MLGCHALVLAIERRWPPAHEENLARQLANLYCPACEVRWAGSWWEPGACWCCGRCTFRLPPGEDPGQLW